MLDGFSLALAVELVLSLATQGLYGNERASNESTEKVSPLLPAGQERLDHPASGCRLAQPQQDVCLNLVTRRVRAAERIYPPPPAPAERLFMFARIRSRMLKALLVLSLWGWLHSGSLVVFGFVRTRRLLPRPRRMPRRMVIGFFRFSSQKDRRRKCNHGCERHRCTTSKKDTLHQPHLQVNRHSTKMNTGASTSPGA